MIIGRAPAIVQRWTFHGCTIIGRAPATPVSVKKQGHGKSGETGTCHPAAMGSLVLQIQQAGRRFDRMLDPVVAELGITLADLPVLVTAVKHRGATLPQLRDWFGYPASTISLAARRLEAQEHVRLRRDTPDGRVLVVYATKPGRVAAEVALARIREIEDRIGRRAGEPAIDACLQVLDAVRGVELPRWMMEVSIPRRRRPERIPAQPSRRRSSARMAASSAGSA